MNKNLLAVLVLLSASMAYADAIISPKSHSFLIPTDKDNTADINQKWTPPALVRQDLQVACKLATTGAGVLAGAGLASNNVLVELGQADSIAFFDTITTTGHSVTIMDTARLIVLVTNDTGKRFQQHSFNPPYPFSNGLVLCTVNAKQSADGRYYLQRK